MWLILLTSSCQEAGPSKGNVGLPEDGTGGETIWWEVWLPLDLGVEHLPTWVR